MLRSACCMVLMVMALGLGCGGKKGGGGENKNLQGVAAVGAPVVGGTVSASCATSVVGDVGTTNDSGSWSGTVAGDATPCLLRVTGGTKGPGGEPNTEVFYSLAVGTDATLTANITPLTSLILAHASQAATSSTDLSALFDGHNNLQAVWDAAESSRTALASALSAAGFTVPDPFDPFRAVFSAAAGDPYDQLLEEVAVAIASDPALDNLEDLQERFIGGDAFPSKPDADSVPATVHASFVKTYSLKFNQGAGAGCNSDCAFTENQVVSATIGSDNSLTLSGKKLTNPFVRIYNGSPHLPEIIWKDDDLEYALTNNTTGIFSEINVGKIAAGATMPTFLGQLREQTLTGAALIAQFAGTFAPTYQYKGTALSWTSMSIGQDGSLTFVGGTGPSLTAAQIGNVSDRKSCCGRIDLQPNFDLNQSGAVDTSDTVRLFYNAANGLQAIEYPVNSNLVADRGVRVDTVTALPMHTGAAIPTSARLQATGTFATGSPAAFDAETFVTGLPQSNLIQLTATLSSGQPPTVQHQVAFSVQAEGGQLAINTPYDCHEYKDAAYIIKLTAQQGAQLSNQYSSINGGRCRITFTKLTKNGGGTQYTAVEGTFTAELFKVRRQDGAMTIANGVFAWSAP